MERVYRISDIKEKLLPVFSSSAVYRAVLFGSYAKGCATENSDVDIVIDSRGELVNINFFGVLEDVVSALDKNVDLLEISEICPGSPIFRDITDNGVVIYERP